MWLNKEELIAIRRVTKTGKNIPLEFRDESEGAYPPEKIGFPAREVSWNGSSVRNSRAYRRAGGSTHIMPSTEKVIVYEAWVKERRARQTEAK